MKRKKNQIIYNQTQLCKEISALYQGTYTLSDIKNIVECFDNCIRNHLAEADKDHPVQIKAFNGISLLSWLVPKQKDANLFGISADIDEYVRVKSDITHYYKRKINELAAEMR